MTYTVLSKANCPYSQAAIKFLRERVKNSKKDTEKILLFLEFMKIEIL